jgi:hypothetical protein
MAGNIADQASRHARQQEFYPRRELLMGRDPHGDAALRAER